MSLALSAAACTTSGQPTAAVATPRGPTVAFESIDGPPEGIFHKVVQTLSDEAEVRQMAVVSRADAAQFRVRSYIAAQSQGKSSTISWVWDVYDADQRRMLRITGEEPASAVGAGTWAVADDTVLRRIAANGMSRLAAFLAAPGTAVRPEAPAEQVRPITTTTAASDDFTPEAAGIFRTAGAASTGFVPSKNLAYLTSGH